jgi:hypothetical protein
MCWIEGFASFMLNSLQGSFDVRRAVKLRPVAARYFPVSASEHPVGQRHFKDRSVANAGNCWPVQNASH